jgi:glucose-6-phosphate dehydrogenase assembly protein OpcA
MDATIRPAKLLQELDNLWVELGKQQHSDGTMGVLRACSMTLIVLGRSSSDAHSLGETLAALNESHPSRVIAINVTEESERRLDARVTAQCWMPFGARRQICSERIEIDSSLAALTDLPPVLRALAVPDLPVVVWCREIELIDSPGVEPLFALAGKIAVNSSGCDDPAWLLDRLAALRDSGRIVADLSWTRLTRWRETLAQLFTDTERRAHLPGIRQATITHYGERPPVRALYLAAWLRNALGPAPRYRFESATGKHPCQLDGEVQATRLDGDGISVSISQVAGETVEVRDGELVKSTVFQTLDDGDLLREELSIEGRDPVYEAVLTTVPLFHQGDAL